jgi:hypothetical protein
VPRANPKLDALQAMLERAGDDPERLGLVERAQRFKRSWIELAESLAALRKSRSYERWGYADLHEYCNRELAIKPATVDKLLLSFGTVTRYAPEVLERDGVAREVPSLDAVDYFSRALGDDERPGPFRRLDVKNDVVEQLRAAVFDEGQGVRELRERFNPVLKPKALPDGSDLARRARDTAKRLLALLPELSALSEARIGRVTAALESLLRDLEAQLEGKASAVSAPRMAQRKKPRASRSR